MTNLPYDDDGIGSAEKESKMNNKSEREELSREISAMKRTMDELQLERDRRVVLESERYIPIETLTAQDDEKLLLATILAGGDREDVIVPAAESAIAVADHVVLIDTGPSAQKAIELVCSLLGDRCSVAKYPGEYGSCTDGRNFSAAVAQSMGYAWYVHVDTDERLIVKDRESVREMLRETKADVVLTRNDLRTYKKHRFFRLPINGKWDGPAHEGFVTSCDQYLCDNVTFHEIPKTPEQQAKHQQAVLDAMLKALETDSVNSRWHYYAGDSAEFLGQRDLAIGHYLQAAALSWWNEEVDWSYYRAACAYSSADKFEHAIAVLRRSKIRIPEHAWQLAYCKLRLGKFEEAVYWGQRAARMGEAQRKTERLGFTFEFAWYEGPHNILHYAYNALGDGELADQEKLEWERQERLRKGEPEEVVS
jgi:tetratricopeptide (TPR) repeat protein